MHPNLQISPPAPLTFNAVKDAHAQCQCSERCTSVYLDRLTSFKALFGLGFPAAALRLPAALDRAPPPRAASFADLLRAPLLVCALERLLEPPGSITDELSEAVGRFRSAGLESLLVHRASVNSCQEWRSAE